MTPTLAAKLFREGNRLPLSRIEIVQCRVGSGTQCLNLQPRGSGRDPVPDRIRRFLVLKFLEHSRRNQNAIEESRQQIRLMNEDQVVQWRGVGDDDHADEWLLREPVARLTIMFEIVKCVMEIHAVLLQKGMRLHLGLVAQ